MITGAILLLFAVTGWMGMKIAEAIFMRQPPMIVVDGRWPWEEAQRRYEKTVRARVFCILLAPMSVGIGGWFIASAMGPQWWHIALVILFGVLAQWANIAKINQSYTNSDKVYKHLYQNDPAVA